MGTTVAPNLTGITTKFPQPQLIALLHNPNAAMRAGHMPAVDISPGNMSALLAYLGVIGTSAANVQASSGTSPQPSSTASQAVSETALPAATNATSSAPSGGQPQSTAPPAAPSSAVAAGRQLYQEHACLACHGATGEGGRAPALAPLIAKLSNDQLTQLLQHPNTRMTAGGMPPFVGSADQIGFLTSYLRSLRPPQQLSQQQPQRQPISQQATREATSQGGSVPYPEMAPAATANVAQPATSASPSSPVSAVATQPSPGRALFLSQGCAACHGPTAHGTQFAPSLVGVTKKFPGDKMPALLRNPTSRMRAGGMPTFNMTDPQMQQLVSYLSSLDTAPPAASTPSASTSTAQSGSRPAAVTQAATPAPLTPLELRGQQIFQHNRCETCHGIGGLTGTVAAPPLAGTASLLPANVLENLLRHHSIRMQQGGMPLTNMNPPDMNALVAFIRSMPSPSDAH